jgi:hypothetical protein
MRLPSWSHQARDEVRGDRVGHVDEHDRQGAVLPLQRRGSGRRMGEDQVQLQGEQLFRFSRAEALRRLAVPRSRPPQYPHRRMRRVICVRTVRSGHPIDFQ